VADMQRQLSLFELQPSLRAEVNHGQFPYFFFSFFFFTSVVLVSRAVSVMLVSIPNIENYQFITMQDHPQNGRIGSVAASPAFVLRGNDSIATH